MRVQTTDIVGDIAGNHPGTIPVFEELGIDYCCGGQRPLKDACALSGVPVDLALSALEKQLALQKGQEEAGGSGRSMGELVAYILENHHRYTRDQLALVKRLSEKVLMAHGAHRPELARLRDLVHEMGEEMEGHMAKEEEQVFPYLIVVEAAGGRKEGIPDPFAGGPLDQHPLKVLMWEHGMTGEEWAEIHRLTGDLTAPPGACPTYRAFYQGLKDLEQDLHRHVHLENNVLFQKAMAAGILD